MTVERERTVYVWDKPHKITIHHKSRTIWIARGEYRGKLIEVKDRSEGSAVRAWIEAARYRGNPPPLAGTAR